MDSDLFKGELVRLTMDDAQVAAEANSRWMRNSGFSRLESSGPAYPHSAHAVKKWWEEHVDEEKDVFAFYIHCLEDDRLIGEISLDGVKFQHGDTFVGISIGDPKDWGKGYGTDAMRIILRYAFQELNLHRVSLDVFEYNPRAIRSYEKAGFKIEGHRRQVLNRDGRRWDMIFMGILREEWEASRKF